MDIGNTEEIKKLSNIDLKKVEFPIIENGKRYLRIDFRFAPHSEDSFLNLEFTRMRRFTPNRTQGLEFIKMYKIPRYKNTHVYRQRRDGGCVANRCYGEKEEDVPSPEWLCEIYKNRIKWGLGCILKYVKRNHICYKKSVRLR
jgi:hypothetical protein